MTKKETSERPRKLHRVLDISGDGKTLVGQIKQEQCAATLADHGAGNRIVATVGRSRAATGNGTGVFDREL